MVEHPFWAAPQNNVTLDQITHQVLRGWGVVVQAQGLVQEDQVWTSVKLSDDGTRLAALALSGAFFQIKRS